MHARVTVGVERVADEESPIKAILVVVANTSGG
jgi:hypothetical protein